VLGTHAVMQAFPGQRAAAAGLWSVVLAVALLGLRDTEVVLGSQVLWLGGAYFTLRKIHVVMDWWLQDRPPPTLRGLIRYSFLAPVILAGPIHRLPTFERSLARRRWDSAQFYSGAERALFGAVLAFVVGEYIYAQILQELAPLNLDSGFGGRLLLSALAWVMLYIAFSGLTDMALGLAAMMGLKLEENFDRPWAARDLIDFWQRWHMTLSHWCRDYVYVPISAWLRAPALGVVSAMIVLGLWHETSAYYLLWALWQALGIILTHRFIRPLAVSGGGALFLVRIGSFLWLALANPVVTTVLEAFA
jgi:D-alanyl-lipoteichoic acid acyltransferase DltB (MBOAT superfamily)